jgi:iron(III) transport system substrate-binding protein
MRLPPTRPLAALLLATVLALAGCGGGAGDAPGSAPGAAPAAGGAASGSAYADYTSLTGQERTDRLTADAAAQGGVLDIYTSNTDMPTLVEGFNKVYPDIKVNVFRANSETVLQRVLQEAGAGRVANDLVDTNDGELRALNDQHVLTSYEGPSRAALRDNALFEGWQATRFNAFVVGWNTAQVPADQAPRSFTDLADPKWKGRVALELGDWDWYASMHTYLTDEKGMAPADVDAMFKQVVANAKVTKGHTVQGELLSAGQFAVAASAYSHTIDNAAVKGAPVTWKPIADPVILRPNGFGLMAQPNHPAAALLWSDWVLSDGQQQIVAANRIPALENVPGFTNPIPDGTPVYEVPDTAITDQSRWSAEWDALLRGAPEAS